MSADHLNLWTRREDDRLYIVGFFQEVQGGGIEERRLKYCPKLNRATARGIYRRLFNCQKSIVVADYLREDFTFIL